MYSQTAAGLVVDDVAGQVGTNGSTDGAALSATFNSPQGVAVDTAGNVYVADTGNHTIRKITAGVVSTLAGQAGVSGTNNGTGASAQLNTPEGICVNGAGTTIYVADTGTTRFALSMQPERYRPLPGPPRFRGRIMQQA